MTKNEAIQEMQKGNKVTHRYFSQNEWMVIQNGKIVLEDGVKCDPHEFWRWRGGESWNDGYELFV